MTQSLDKKHFDALLNQEFTVSVEDKKTKLELAEIAVPERSPSGFECYTLLFKGNADVFLEQGIYRFEAKNFEGTDLFLVPVAGDQTGYDYEVVINHKPEA